MSQTQPVDIMFYYISQDVNILWNEINNLPTGCIWFLVSNLMHLFITSFHIPLHVSSHIVLIIRRIYCIYTASGSLCVTLLVWPFSAQAVRGLLVVFDSTLKPQPSQEIHLVLWKTVFVTLSTRAHQFFLYWGRSFQFTPCHSIFL